MSPESEDFQSLLVPGVVQLIGDWFGTTHDGTYDIEAMIPGSQRPQASGVYTDTITLTIMDDTMG